MNEIETRRMISPYEFEVTWHLALVNHGEDATAADVFEHGFRHGRPPPQRWGPHKIAVVMQTLVQRGLVASSQATDEGLPGRPVRRYRLTEKGEKWLRA